MNEMHANWCYDCATKAPQNNPDPPHHHAAAGGSSYCQNTNEDATPAEEQHNADPRHETSSPQEVPQEELQRPVVNNILAGIRERMNLETVKRKTWAANTFYKHQLESVHFIMWLYKSSYKSKCLVPELINELNAKSWMQHIHQRHVFGALLHSIHQMLFSL